MASGLPLEISPHINQGASTTVEEARANLIVNCEGVFANLPDQATSLLNRVSLGSVLTSERDQLLDLLRAWDPACDESEKVEISELILECYDLKSPELSISSSFIRSLPDVFLLSGFSNLKDLYVESCPRLSSIPESVGNLSSLEIVSFDHCQSLEVIPENMGNLTALEVLSFNGCSSLTTIPETLGRLGSLTNLSLEDCTSLTAIPMMILDLPHECVVDLIGCSIPEAVIGGLISASRCEGYNGPEIRLNIPEEHQEESPHSLAELLTKTFTQAKMETEDLPNLMGLEDEKKQLLRMWLSRMADTADGGPNHLSGFYRVIVNHLKLADANEEFREIFFQVLHEASRTCGDRVSLSILHLGIAARKITCDKTDLKAFAKLLNGSLALDLLEQVARAKVESMPSVDEIEVYLGYPIKLKEELNLPIDIQEMRFFACSGITQMDLESAKTFVLSHIDDQDLLLARFVKNEEWVIALKAKYPERSALIEDHKEQALDVEEPDYILIEKDYHQALIDLSKEALA